jgi:hypothetical protein
MVAAAPTKHFSTIAEIKEFLSSKNIAIMQTPN